MASCDELMRFHIFHEVICGLPARRSAYRDNPYLCLLSVDVIAAVLLHLLHTSLMLGRFKYILNPLQTCMLSSSGAFVLIDEEWVCRVS